MAVQRDSNASFWSSSRHNPDLIDQALDLGQRHASRVTVIDVVEDTDGFHGLLPVASAEELRTVLVDARRG